MEVRTKLKAEEIAISASLAMMLEAAAYPKPGNVHRLKDFEETYFEHFLASSASVQPVFLKIAEKSALKENEAISFGPYFEEAIRKSQLKQTGGNTHFGTLILLLPIAAAAGKIGENWDGNDLIEKASDICRKTTFEDAVHFYNAFSRFSIPVVKKEVASDLKYDLTDAASIDNIKANKISLFDLMTLGSERDMIAMEWVNGFEKSKLFAKKLQENKIRFENNPKKCFGTAVNSAIVYTFIEFLARYPDTFISTKFNEKEALKIQKKAAKIIEKKNKTKNKIKNKTKGKKKNLKKMIRKIEKLDQELQKKKMNPGSIADIAAAGLFISLLEGMKI